MIADGLYAGAAIQGSQPPTNAGPFAHDNILDRCLVHPGESGITSYYRSIGSGIEPGGPMTIIDSLLYDFGYYATPPIDYVIGGGNVNTWLVASATNASPCVVTLAGTGNTFLDSGAISLNRRPIALRGGTGGWAALNTVFVGRYISPTEVELENYDPATGNRTPLNSSGFGSFSGQTVKRLYIAPADSRAFGTSGSPGPFVIDNSMLEAFVYPLIFGGGGSTGIPAQNMTTVVSSASIDKVILAELGDLAVGDLIAFKTARPQAVTAASATNPIVLTVEPHRFPVTNFPKLGNAFPGLSIAGITGDMAFLNSGGPTGPPPAGAHFFGKVTSATTIEVWANNSTPVSGLGLTPFSGSATWIPNSPADPVYPGESWQVGRVTAINTGTKEVTFAIALHSVAEILGPAAYGHGNGAGVQIAAGSIAHHNGMDVGPLTVTRSTIGTRREWHWLMAHNGKCGNFQGHVPKGMMEFKTGTHVLYEGCHFTVTGGSMAPMSAHSFVGNNQVNQVGASPWINLNDWTFRYCLIEGMTAFKTGHIDEFWTSVHSSGLLVEHCLFTDTGVASDWLFLAATQNAIFRHNTVLNGSQPLVAALPQSGLRFLDNIFCLGTYGYSLSEGATIAESTNNYIIDNLGFGAGYWNDPPKYGADHLVLGLAAMQFEDLPAANAGDWRKYRLAVGSPGHLASDGGTKDAGVDIDALEAALGGTAPLVVGPGTGRLRWRGSTVIPRRVVMRPGVRMPGGPTPRRSSFKGRDVDTLPPGRRQG